MNFFERQAQARRNSTRLLVLFALAVAGIVIAVDVAAWFGGAARSAGGLLFWSLLTLGVITLGSLYRVASLRSGGDRVALDLGGTPVPDNPVDLDLKRLRNVVEEIAIASGVPVPRLFVLEKEAGINAFAAGYSPSDAAVAVTRGALDRLNRDELQGVIAHEFSHVLNGDMRLNIRLIGVLFGILMISLIGRKILEHGRFGGRNKGGGAIMMAAVAALVIGSLGLFFGRLIKAGVSRSREVLADASAVQFTRQTQGLAGALKKIAGLQTGSQLAERGDAEEISHMLFGDGIGLRGLFATHPPLLARIQALEPGFSDDALARLQAQWLARPPMGLEEDVALGLDGHAGSRLPGASQQVKVSPPQVSAQVATPAADDYRRADGIVEAIPEALRDLAAGRETVMPLLLAMLLDPADEALAERQRGVIATSHGQALAEQALGIHQQLTADLHPMLRLPLASLAFPVLRLRPRPELQAFMATVDALVHADGAVSLFEYCLGKLLHVHVRESLDPARHARFGRRKPAGVREEFALLLAVVAHAGHADEPSARRAYLAGMQRILPRDHLAYAPPSGGVQVLDRVWEPLDALDPLAKEVLVEALVDAISHDGRIAIAEAELLRTVCAVLHCPLPPVLEH